MWCLKSLRTIAAEVLICSLLVLSQTHSPAQSWYPTTAPTTNTWQSIVCSQDGSIVIAVQNNSGLVYRSNDSGATWEVVGNNNVDIGNWFALSCSADASVVAGVDNGIIYYSEDSGTTWNQASWDYLNANGSFWTIACSKKSSNLAAAQSGNAYGSDLYVSTDSGADWTDMSQNYSFMQNYWQCVAISDDGNKIVAGSRNFWLLPGYMPDHGACVYVSTDAGQDWWVPDIPDGNAASVTCSADGSKMAALVNGTLYCSTDSGYNWSSNYAGGLSFTSLMNAGNTLLGIGSSVWISSDWGKTWFDTGTPGPPTFATGIAAGSLTTVAASADGSKLFAIIGDTIYGYPGGPVTQLVRPGDGTVVSPDRRLFTLTNSYVGKPQSLKYEVDIEGPNISQTNDLGFEFTSSTSKTVDIFGKSAFRLTEGRYSWRARATLASNNEPGPWTPYYSFVVFGGCDLSASASLQFFNYLKSQHWSFVIADGFGGRSVFPQAQSNLLNAAAAGFTNLAVYCYLNFDNGAKKDFYGNRAPTNQTGTWQVGQALLASGLAGPNPISIQPAFVAIDVEIRYPGKMSKAQRVARIAEAVAAVQNAGYQPVIYARNNNNNGEWDALTGKSQAFAGLPLWDVNYAVLKQEPFDDLQLDVLKSKTIPFISYGGWSQRSGKQYLENQFISKTTVDLDVFDPSLFGVSY